MGGIPDAPSPEAQPDDVFIGQVPSDENAEAVNFAFTDPYGNEIRFTYVDAHGNPAPVKIAIEYANGASVYINQSDTHTFVVNSESDEVDDGDPYTPRPDLESEFESNPDDELLKSNTPYSEYYPTGPDWPDR